MDVIIFQQSVVKLTCLPKEQVERAIDVSKKLSEELIEDLYRHLARLDKEMLETLVREDEAVSHLEQAASQAQRSLKGKQNTEQEKLERDDDLFAIEEQLPE